MLQRLQVAALRVLLKNNLKFTQSYSKENYTIMKTLITYFRDNSTSEDYLFLLAVITLTAALVRTIMLLNNNLLVGQLSSFLR